VPLIGHGKALNSTDGGRCGRKRKRGRPPKTFPPEPRSLTASPGRSRRHKRGVTARQRLLVSEACKSPPRQPGWYPSKPVGPASTMVVCPVGSAPASPCRAVEAGEAGHPALTTAPRLPFSPPPVSDPNSDPARPASDPNFFCSLARRFPPATAPSRDTRGKLVAWSNQRNCFASGVHALSTPTHALSVRIARPT